MELLMLSDVAITQIVTAIVALAGMGTAYIALKKQMVDNAKAAAERDIALNKKVERIETHTNGMTEKLNVAMKALGVSEGEAKEKARSETEKATIAMATLAERDKVEAEKDKSPPLVVKEGKVVIDNPFETPIVVDTKSKPGLRPDDKKEAEGDKP